MTNQPTVYEQQLIRDQGDEFRTRMKTAIKKFDVLVNPLRLAIRNMIKQILKDTIQAETDEALINNFYFKYFTKYEDQHFRFTLQCLNFIFDSERQFNFNEDLNYKYVAIIYSEQIRNYLKEQNDRVLIRLWDKLNSLKQEKEKDELEEGFWDELENENWSQKSKRENGNNDQTQQSLNEFCHTRKEMQLKELLIQSLQTKLFARESNLVQITAGYLKELQSLREQLFRKEQTYVGVDEIFEVSFMDFTEVLDPQLKKLFTAHTTDLKLQFNNKMIDYFKLIQAQKDELKNYKIQVQRLTQQLNSIEGPSELLKKLFTLDDNPYRIWKYIADAKGNFFFKEVFESQKAVYGINYQEVNQLLLTNKAYEREYQSYKDLVQQEQIVFYEKIQKEVEELTKQLVRADQEKQQILRQRENDKLLFLQIARQNYEQRIQSEVDIVKEGFKGQLVNISQNIEKMDKLKVKFAFKLWVAMSKVHNNQDLKKILMEAEFFDDKLISSNEKIKELEKQLILEKTSNIDLIAKLSLQEYGQAKYQNESQSMQYKLDQLEQKQQQIHELQIQVRQLETTNQITSSFCTKLLRLIDSRLASVKITDVDLDSKSKEVVKSIIATIKQLNYKSLRAISEVKEQGLINKEAYQILIQKLYQDKEVQTDPELEHKNKKTKTLESEEGSKKITPSIHRTQNSQQQNDDFQNTSQQQVKKEKPKLIVKRSEADMSQVEENKKNLEEQSTLLSPLKVLKNFDFKQQVQPTQTIQKSPPKIKANNQFQELQDFQSEQVIQLLEVNEQVEQESQLFNRKREEQQNKSNINIIKQTLDPNATHTQMNKRTNYYTSQQQTRKQADQKASSVPQTLSARNSKSFRLRATSQNKQSKTPEVFEKLYNDGEEKNERIKNLKENLELLEKSHWNEILDLFSNQPSGNYILNDFIPPKVQECSFNFLETGSFQKMCSKRYYNQIKCKTPNKPNYKSWIMKQTNCIDKMFNTLNNINTKPQQEEEMKQILNCKILLPTHLFDNLSKKQML